MSNEALVERVARAIDPRAWSGSCRSGCEYCASDRESSLTRARAALAAMPSACPAGGSGWIKTTDRLPEKPWNAHYEYVECLIWVRGGAEIALWNCEHLVWDDRHGDDFLYRPTEPTYWMPIHAPETAAEPPARSGEETEG